MKQSQKLWKKAAVGGVGCIALLVVGFITYLTITEYRPEAIETKEVIGAYSEELSLEDTVSVVSYNIGYGCDGKESDFFMDGGEMVRPDSVEIVEKNMNGIVEILQGLSADVMFLQEIDTNSKRAYGINEVEWVYDAFENAYNYTFGITYKTNYVSYPLHEHIGRVESGVMTLNSFEVEEAVRYNLPCSYNWPIRLMQLKRGLLVERVPLADSDREVVFVNLHLEAYAAGEKKEAQTKVLVDLLQSEYEKGNYVIAGGDFNQYFPGMNTEEIYPIYDGENYRPEEIDADMLPEDWIWSIDLSTPSCRLLNEPYNPQNEQTQYYAIDGFILSPNVKVETVETIDTQFEYSDHNPVRIEVSFEP